MTPNDQFLLYCQTGVYDCSGSMPDWGWRVIGGGVLAIIATLAVIVWDAIL